jgi:hypothetical protein
VARVKKTKQPGDNISLKTKKTEDPAVMNWLNAQSNLMDSLRYLIEQEIAQHGVRNLQTVVPMERNVLTSIPIQQGGRLEVPRNADRVVEGFQEVDEEISAAVEVVPEEEIEDEDIAAWI